MYYYEHTNGVIISKPDIVVDTLPIRLTPTPTRCRESKISDDAENHHTSRVAVLNK